MSEAEQFPFNEYDDDGSDSTELLPPSKTVKRKLLNQASAIAKRTPRKPGNPYQVEQPVPDTDADTLAIAYFDPPSQKPGTKGLNLQVIHRENVGEPDVYEEDNHKDYSRTVTTYTFWEIPDGIHVDKQVTHRLKFSMRPQAIPQTSEDFNVALGALTAKIEAAAQSEALEREMGMRFFSQHDAEELQRLLDKTWPQA